MRGFKEQWDEFSLGLKIFSVILICCVGLAVVGGIIGLLTPDANTPQQTLTGFADNLTGAKNSSGGDVIVSDGELEIRISCPVKWSASIGDKSTSTMYDGTGDAVIEVNPDKYDVIAAAVQKTNAGKEKLKVQIVKDGKVVDEGTTTEDYGVVTVSATVK